jgi:hypothetical protein
MWVKRDHQSEWKQWEARLNHIGDRAKAVDGVTYNIAQPSADLSNRSPKLTIQWDGAKLGITGMELSKTLLDTEPRIVVAGATGSRMGSMASTLSIIPYQMIAGEENIVADRIYALLSKPPKFKDPDPPPSGQPATVAGQWEAHLEFGRGSATHTIVLEQNGPKLAGTHHGEYFSGDLAGTVAANTVRFRSMHRVHGTQLSYDFTGSVEGDRITGTVNMGEYGTTAFTAQRHQYQAGGRRRG